MNDSEKPRPTYKCAECEEEASKADVAVCAAVYVARNNMPLHWALCERHYGAASPTLREHYARMRPRSEYPGIKPV